MERPEVRQRLSAILTEESAALAELASYLEREHGHLSADDVVALEGAIRERQRAVARVVRADEERAALCRQLGHPADGRGLAQLLRLCDVDGSLAAEWARCRGAAAHCRALNDRNSALAGARLRHVQARLAALFSSRGETVAYGKRGGYALGTVGQVVKVKA
ncbi:MAG TPA: flagellar protein FlgN [Steroidobacteraceae bacterium]|nr:flagellar protein FlgN [Steroidobacteraceae bacterium]